MRVRNQYFAIAAALIGAAAAVPAQAYQVSPMIYDLKPSGPGATTTVRVQNDGDKPITIEVTAERREFDEAGKETRTPADSEFILFPPQAVVQAGKTQALRVQYVGAPQLDRSAMYVVTVKQVPVELPTGGPSGVQFVFNFGTVANVVPAGAKADVQVAAVTPAAGGGWQVRLHNAGKRYANLSLGGMTLSDGTRSVALTGEVWRKSIGPSWLLPEHDRVLTIPAQSGLSGAVTARFDAETTGKS